MIVVKIKNKDDLIIWDEANEGLKEAVLTLKTLHFQKEEIQNQLEHLRTMEMDVRTFFCFI